MGYANYKFGDYFLDFDSISALYIFYNPGSLLKGVKIGVGLGLGLGIHFKISHLNLYQKI